MKTHITPESFVSKTLRTIKARPLWPEDAPYLVDLFENMSAESRYSRFLQSVDHVGLERVWTEAETISHMTQDSGRGLIAFADLPDRKDAPVAAARYVRLGDNKAEMAVSVRDDMQNMGIGTYLLARLVEQAEADGIDQLVGVVNNGNTLIWAVMNKLGRRIERQPDDGYSLVILHVREPAALIVDGVDTAADFSPEPQIIW
jgi:acetyltransferase